jgi:hypothetical protein
MTFLAGGALPENLFTLEDLTEVPARAVVK